MIIFDLDGTLIDSNTLWQEVDHEFLSRRGLTITPEYVALVTRSIFPIAAQITIDYYGVTDTPEEIMAEWEALADHHYRELVPLKVGAVALLEHLRRNNTPIALFTASRPALCYACLEHYQLTEYFDRIIFAEEIGLEKHNPACFQRLSELLGLPPEQCTLIDDSPENCATANASGMATIGVYDAFRTNQQDELRRIANRYVHSLEELIDNI